LWAGSGGSVKQPPKSQKVKKGKWNGINI
jgi:hypothetical protein